ncbi:MAG: hypothetical protein IJO27_01045 [Bacilli bacterium]|nr:hypothetical protein [Bacilli bacterium]MBQ6816998.1 hypothetical protein [Bacilli bacterium]
MKTRIKIMLVFMSLVLTVSLMSNTYSRYVADTTGSLEVQFAKWKILVNENDITSGNVSSIELTPVVDENENVAQNKLAPSSKGYFDIEIDPTDVEVSFDYEISLEVLNENIPDLLVTKYSLIKGNTDLDKDSIDRIDIVDNVISGTFRYKNVASGSDEVFAFEPFTIRVYFEWVDNEEVSTMSDEADTQIGLNAEDYTLQIKANIKFEQNVSPLTEEERTELYGTPSDDVIE